MKLRTRTWALISLVCFIAAAWFWHLGNQREAQRLTGNVTNNLAAKRTNASAQPMSLVSLGPSGAPRPATNATALANAATNWFRYRLSNTTEPLDQLQRSDHALLLRNALIDTANGQPLPIPASLRVQGDPGSYLVQARGQITEAFRQALSDAGAQIISYVPVNAYLVRADAAAARSLGALPLTQAVLPFEPYYKLEPSLLVLAVEDQPLPDNTELNLTLFPGQRDRIVAALQAMNTAVLREERSPFGPTLRITSSGNTLPLLAALPGVQIIEQARQRRPANDLTRPILHVATNTTSPVNVLGFNGSGLGPTHPVAVADTGVWAGHPDLQDASLATPMPSRTPTDTAPTSPAPSAAPAPTPHRLRSCLAVRPMCQAQSSGPRAPLSAAWLPPSKSSPSRPSARA